MKTPLERKSSVEDIRRRFDADVERFSNMETGQQATIDAPLVWVHLVWLPRHGVNGWTGEPRDRYLELMAQRRSASGRG